jgi:hypothetical protein
VNPAHLQAVTGQKNRENLAGPYRNNTSGIRGVGLNKRTGRWFAYAKHNGVRYNGGTYETKEEAGIAAVKLRKQLMTNNLLDLRA